MTRGHAGRFAAKQSAAIANEWRSAQVKKSWADPRQRAEHVRNMTNAQLSRWMWKRLATQGLSRLAIINRMAIWRRDGMRRTLA